MFFTVKIYSDFCSTDLFDSLLSFFCSFLYSIFNQIGVMIVVTATMITIVEYTSDVRIPAVTPTPATIYPTSPLEIIPIPTLIP